MIFILLSFKVRTPDSSELDPFLDARNVFEKGKQRREELMKKISQYVHPNSQNETISLLQIQNDFKITLFSPTRISTDTGHLISIKTSPTLKSTVFCKFDNKILVGKLLSNKTIVCKSPQLLIGLVKLSVSENKFDWSNSVQLEVFSPGFTISPILIIPIVALLILVFSGIKIMKKKKPISKSRKHKLPLDMEDHTQSTVKSQYKDTKFRMNAI